MGIISYFPVRGASGRNSLPEFTYTGTYQLIDDGYGDWRIKFIDLCRAGKRRERH